MTMMATFGMFPTMPQCPQLCPFPISKFEVPNQTCSGKTLKLISWSPPPQGWVKLNTDGAYKKSIDLATAGGLIRDSLGRWFGGFALNIGSVTSLEAEYLGILYGLQLAWKMGFRRVIVESDCKAAVDHIIKINGCDSDNLVLQTIREYLTRDWFVIVQHQYREANQAADWLANAAVGMVPGCHELRFPVGISNIMMQDIRGVKFARITGSS